MASRKADGCRGCRRRSRATWTKGTSEGKRCTNVDKKVPRWDEKTPRISRITCVSLSRNLLIREYERMPRTVEGTRDKGNVVGKSM